MAKRPGPGPDLDDIDADLRATPEEIAAELAAAMHEEDDSPHAAALRSGALDLHTFRPGECADVVAEYLLAAQAAGLTAVRIIHGKGTGTLRRIVHGVLDRHPAVQGYRLATDRSGWGATLVDLTATLSPPQR
jgi:dsDNA-specific endonuclease/ATPase MutS2